MINLNFSLFMEDDDKRPNPIVHKFMQLGRQYWHSDVGKFCRFLADKCNLYDRTHDTDFWKVFKNDVDKNIVQSVGTKVELKNDQNQIIPANKQIYLSRKGNPLIYVAICRKNIVVPITPEEWPSKIKLSTGYNADVELRTKNFDTFIEKQKELHIEEGSEPFDAVASSTEYVLQYLITDKNFADAHYIYGWKQSSHLVGHFRDLIEALKIKNNKNTWLINHVHEICKETGHYTESLIKRIVEDYIIEYLENETFLSEII